MRKYSCSEPQYDTTIAGFWCPKSLRMRCACVLRACMARKSGVLVSRASPVHETKHVGMQSVLPLGVSNRYAGLVTSQAVYPRASKVARMPPFGKLEASGSPCTSVLPENSMIAPPSPSGDRKQSCFSAVSPVSG